MKEDAMYLPIGEYSTPVDFVFIKVTPSFMLRAIATANIVYKRIWKKWIENADLTVDSDKTYKIRETIFLSKIGPGLEYIMSVI